MIDLQTIIWTVCVIIITVGMFFIIRRVTKQ